MLKPVHPVRVNHINLVVEDFDASVEHFRGVYGAEFLMDMPQREWHACLMDMGRVILELFVPPAFLLNARYGPNYLGIEYQADLTHVREAVASHGIRIARDIGVALHTHPADCLGVAFEFYDGYFHDNEQMFGGKMKSAAYWRAQHPLGLTGLKATTVAVHDIDAASRFLQSFLSAEPLYETLRPSLCARAIGLQVADSIVELLAPTEPGPLDRHLRNSGQGLYSTIFRVGDIEQARRYLVEHKMTPLVAEAENMLAVAADENLGVVFEFSE